MSLATVLPSWLVETLPTDLPEPVSIYIEEGVVKTSNPDLSFFSSIEEAYDALNALNLEVSFDKSATDLGGHFLFEGDTDSFICEPKEGEESSRFLLAYPTFKRIKDLEETYLDWANKVVPAYLVEPKVFIKAYNFVNAHPAFWLQNAKIPVSWETDYGCGQVDVNAYVREEKVEVLLETGMHIAPEYTSRYLDMDIVSYAPTFEEAYILLASKIYSNYNLDGTSKS